MLINDVGGLDLDSRWQGCETAKMLLSCYDFVEVHAKSVSRD